MIKYTSIDRLISKVERDFKSDIPDIDIIEWAGECLSKLPTNIQYEEKVVSIPYKEYKCLLPNGFVGENQVAFNNGYQLIPMIKSTYTLGLQKEDYRYEYVLDGCYLVSSEKEGEIVLSYYSYPYDDNGYPMIPDDDYYLEAISKYIHMMYVYPKFIRGEANMERIYSNAVLEYNASVRKLKANTNMPKNASDYETMLRTQNTLVPNYNRFSGFFGTFNKNQINNLDGSADSN